MVHNTYGVPLSNVSRAGAASTKRILDYYKKGSILKTDQEFYQSVFNLRYGVLGPPAIPGYYYSPYKPSYFNVRTNELSIRMPFP